MGRINIGRVLGGGLLAGLVIVISETILNVPILGQRIAMALADAGLEESAMAIPVYTLFGLSLGIAAVWLYAAIRSRFGAGPRTAVYAGVVVWLLVWGTYLAHNVAVAVYPPGVMWLSVVWGAIEMPLATIAGAFIYKEAAA